MPDEIRLITPSLIDVNPWQPREEFSREELDGLAASIKQHGILQPLVVTETEGRYQLIAGERRLRAAKIAGLNKIPAIIREASEEQQLELAIIENIQRQDLNPLERAKAYERLMREFSMTQQEVATRVGKTRPAVANALRLLELPDEIKDAISSGRLSEGHAKVIAGLPKDDQVTFFHHVSTQQLSVRETERQGKILREKRAPKRTVPQSVGIDDDDLAGHYRSLLESELATKVEIADKSGSGSVTIHYFSEEELRNVVKKIVGNEQRE